LGISAAILGPTLPGLAQQTRTGLDQISSLFTTRSLGYMLGSLYLGRAFDRLPGHRLLALMLFGIALTAALVPLAPQLWLLVIILLVMGLGEGSMDTGANLLLLWVHHRNAAPFVNALHFSFGVGAIIGPVIIAQILAFSGQSVHAFWFLALLPIPLIVWLLFIPSPSAPARHSELAQGSDSSLLLALLALLLFLYVAAEVAFGGWVYTYTIALGLSSAEKAAYLTSLFWGALTVGRLLTIPIAARVRPRIILLVSLVGTLLSVGIILAFPASFLVIQWGSIGLGFSMAAIFPITLAFAERRLVMSGQTTRWFFVAAGAGGMLLPWVIGQLFEPYGPQSAMIIILVDLVLALLVFLWVSTFARRTDPVPNPGAG